MDEDFPGKASHYNMLSIWLLHLRERLKWAKWPKGKE